MKKDRTVLYGALVLIGVYVIIQYQKNKKPKGDSSNFMDDGNRYNTKRSNRKRANSGFLNATGCSSQDLSDLMDTCNGMDEAQGATSVGIRSCKVKRNGTRIGRCKFEYSNGNVIERDVTVGGRIRANRNVASF